MKKIVVFTTVFALLLSINSCKKTPGIELFTKRVELNADAQTVIVTTDGVDMVQCIEGEKLLGTGNAKIKEISGDWFVLKDTDEFWKNIEIKVEKNTTEKDREFYVSMMRRDTHAQFSVVQKAY